LLKKASEGFALKGHDFKVVPLSSSISARASAPERRFSFATDLRIAFFSKLLGLGWWTS
jgi:hypothetical protein